jgi:hypothetical protein
MCQQSSESTQANGLGNTRNCPGQIVVSHLLWDFKLVKWWLIEDTLIVVFEKASSPETEL